MDTDPASDRRIGLAGRRLGAAAVMVAIGIGLFALVAHQRHGEWVRGLLRQVVGICAFDQAHFGLSFPCDSVSLPTLTALGHAVVRSPGLRTEVLVVPTAPADGIESPILREDVATSLWAAAWSARSWVSAAAGRPLPPERIALTVNARGTRTQDQFHIHVDCLDGPIAEILQARAADISQAWAAFPQRLRGEYYWARRIDSLDLAGVNVLKLVADGLPGAAADMSRVTLALAPVTLEGGHREFVVLGNTRNRSAERLMDHACRGA